MMTSLVVYSSINCSQQRKCTEEMSHRWGGLYWCFILKENCANAECVLAKDITPLLVEIECVTTYA